MDAIKLLRYKQKLEMFLFLFFFIVVYWSVPQTDVNI